MTPPLPPQPAQSWLLAAAHPLIRAATPRSLTVRFQPAEDGPADIAAAIRAIGVGAGPAAPHSRLAGSR